MQMLFSSRAQYLLLERLVSRFFSSRPSIDFLQNASTDVQLFQRYLMWSAEARSWTHLQKTTLDNIYWRKSYQQTFRPAMVLKGAQIYWAHFLKYYLYTSLNSAPLAHFFKSHPYLSVAQQKDYEALIQSGCLPSFQEVFHHLSPPSLLSQAICDHNIPPSLCFSSSAHMRTEKAPSDVLVCKGR